MALEWTRNSDGVAGWRDPTGGSLPSWWTDNGDVLGLTMTMPSNFKDAIVVDVGDVANLSDSAYILRGYDSVNDKILWDFDGYGSLAVFGENLGGNVGGILITNQTGQTLFKVFTNGLVELGPGGLLEISGTQIGFFGNAASQQTGVAVSAAAIHAALVSYGLITA